MTGEIYFLRCKGIKWRNKWKFVLFLSDKKVGVIFFTPAKKSPKYENEVNLKRIVIRKVDLDWSPM